MQGSLEVGMSRVCSALSCLGSKVEWVEGEGVVGGGGRRRSGGTWSGRGDRGRSG